MKNQNLLKNFIVALIYIFLGSIGGFVFFIFFGLHILNKLFFIIPSRYYSPFAIIFTITIWLFVGPLFTILGIDLVFKKFNLLQKIILTIITGGITWIITSSIPQSYIF